MWQIVCNILDSFNKHVKEAMDAAHRAPKGTECQCWAADEPVVVHVCRLSSNGSLAVGQKRSVLTLSLSYVFSCHSDTLLSL